MLVIRLARTGRKKYPTYRIVAAESARPTTGKFVAILGNYNPHTKALSLNKDEALRYIGHGAQPSNAVIKLMQQEKVDLPAWAKLETKNRPPKKVVEPEAPAAPEASETSEAEAPAEDASIAATAEAADTAAEDQNVNQADDSDEGAMPTAASEEAQAEAAVEAEDTAAEVALDAAETESEA